MKIVIAIILLINNVQASANVDSLKLTVFFDLNSFGIRANEYERLNSNLQEVDPELVSKIIIWGYCDDTGRKEYNDTLSLKRALSVNNVIKDLFQITDSIEFAISGKGSIPVDTNLLVLPEEQRARSRKVDIVIINKTDPISNENIEEDRTELLLKALDEGGSVELRNILFEAGRSKFLPQAQDDLSILLSFLRRNSSYHIKIIGHIHFAANNSYNLPKKESIDLDTGNFLSEERAKAVYTNLVNNGIAAERLSYEGQGGLYPTEKGGFRHRPNTTQLHLQPEHCAQPKFNP